MDTVEKPVDETSAEAGEDHRFAQERAEEIFSDARRASRKNDFILAVETIEKIPEVFRTEAMQAFHKDACRQRDYIIQMDHAHTYLEEHQYEQAVHALEKIPEPDRDEKCLELLKEARMLENSRDALVLARRRFKVQDFEETIRILEAIPKEQRPEPVIALLMEAHTNVRKLADLWLWIGEAWKKAEASSEWKDYEEILSLLDDVLEIRPEDSEALERKAEIEVRRQKLKERDAILQKAKLFYKNRSYQSALENLDTVEQEIRTEAFNAYYEDVQLRLQEVHSRFEKIKKAIAENDITAQLSNLETLDNDLFYATEQFIAELNDEEFENCLTQIAASCRETEEHDDQITLLERYLDAVNGMWVAHFLTRAKPEFLDNFPVECNILAEKLGEVLRAISDHPERILETLDLVRQSEEFLGRNKQLLDDWDEFLRLADQFGHLEELPWSTRECWIESPKSLELDELAYNLVKVAVHVIPSDRNRWDRIKDIGQLLLGRTEKPFLRVYAKMQNYLNKPVAWSSKPLVWITPSRVKLFVTGVAGMTALGLAAHIGYKLLFEVGGMLGYGLAGFLLVLWAAFGFIAYRFLED
ncbi:MAG: hypothetical protein Tsb009_32170 [Planctomycetaceae bacterium]